MATRNHAKGPIYVEGTMNPRIDLDLPLVLTIMAIALGPMALLGSWIGRLGPLGFVLFVFGGPPLALIGIVIAVLYFIRRPRIQETVEVVVLTAWLLWFITHFEGI